MQCRLQVNAFVILGLYPSWRLLRQSSKELGNLFVARTTHRHGAAPALKAGAVAVRLPTI